MSKHRKIIRIDEDKCDGCGQCVAACAEGAIQVIDGKARLVSEAYCDGLGACLGECPQDAITMEEREVEEFDAKAVEEHLKAKGNEISEDKTSNLGTSETSFRACPGALAQTLFRRESARTETSGKNGSSGVSFLQNWPIQLALAPVQDPYFQNARLLISADCVPFALPDFHERFLAGRVLLVACPKLDDASAYRRKLADIFLKNNIQSVEVTFMEVPCCHGLAQLVHLAIGDADKDVPIKLTKLGILGAVCETIEARLPPPDECLVVAAVG